ncbi:MAG: IS1595 family transposase [Dehalococcoidia bacterium]
MERYTIARFNTDFPDEDACLARVLSYVYPDGITCRTCTRVRPHSRRAGRKSYECASCGTEVFPMAGTIFEKSTTPLKSWFYAMYLMAQTRCGISAKQLERELGVTYKTAWRMFTQIRKLMDEDGGLLQGEVEVDETWHGGKLQFKGRQGFTGPVPGSQSLANKTPIVGAVERGGRVKAKVVSNVRKGTLLPLVSEHIMPHATVFTDEHAAYNDLPKRGYEHHRVNHSARVYVMGNVHTNTIEGFWSLLKNGIRGAHHAVGAAYLQSYVDEYTFRYNHRDDTAPMFRTLSLRTNQVRHGRYGVYNPVGE